MGKDLERRISRILSEIRKIVKEKPRHTPKQIGYYTLIGDKRYLSSELEQRELEDAILFICQVLNFSDPTKLWQMDVFEFYRNLVRSYRLHDQQITQLKKQADAG